MAEKILIIEDEPSIADNISFVLDRENFIPVWCATAEEGRKEISGGGISLLILDIGLPDMNGIEFCKELRKTESLPVIFLTARAEEIDRILGLEIGADDYVTKPFSPRELAARVKAVLRRTNQTGTSPELNDNESKPDNSFQLDEERHEISYCGILLRLSRYEYKLLRLLLKHPGRVFSRKQLMERAWEEPEASMERTVDTHIKTIRTKLKAINPDREPVITHRGFGYSLAETL